MTRFLKNSWSLIGQAAADWIAHKDARAGAAVAYYSVFSLGPLMVIATAIAGVVFGRSAARGEIDAELRGVLGDSAASAVDAMLAGADKPHQGVIATVIGAIILLFTALGVVIQLKDAFNAAWEVDAKQLSGTWPLIRDYLVSLAAVIALGILLVVSLLFTAGLSAANQYFGAQLAAGTLQTGGTIVSFAVITVVFALMFKFLPDARVEWRDVWIGAAITAALLELGKILLAIYIAEEAFASTYGAAASVIVLLVWVYYSSQIVLFGAEFTHVHARWHWQTGEPSRDTATSATARNNRSRAA